MKLNKTVIGIALSFGISCGAYAGVIADRTTLNNLLGSTAVTHDFETAPVISGASTSSYAGVVISGSNSIQYNNPGYYGAPSHELDPYYTTGTFDFTSPVSAFGMDIRAYAGYQSTISATVYAADDVTAIANVSNLFLSGSGVPIFFGFQDSSIGRVVFDIDPQNTYAYYANFDNLTFGGATDVPEPASLALLGIALAGLSVTRRRKAA